MSSWFNNVFGSGGDGGTNLTNEAQIPNINPITSTFENVAIPVSRILNDE